MQSEDGALLRKLGLSAKLRSYTLHAPAGYNMIVPYPVALARIDDLPPNLEWLQAFYTTAELLDHEITHMKASLSSTGQLWLCWPKKSAATKSDLSDGVVRRFGLQAGLVDVKVVAIDQTWSALKFVYHLEDRS